MDYIILKYTPLTIDELKSDLSYSYNVIIIFSILFVICLLSFIIREIIFFKNKKKLDLDKRDFNLFDFLQSVVMGVSFVVVLFSIFSYSNKSETLKRVETGETVRVWKGVSLTEIKDNITIYNNKLRIEKLPKNFKYSNVFLYEDSPKEFEISYYSNNKKAKLRLDEDEEYRITAEELKEIQENKKNSFLKIFSFTQNRFQIFDVDISTFVAPENSPSLVKNATHV